MVTFIAQGQSETKSLSKKWLSFWAVCTCSITENITLSRTGDVSTSSCVTVALCNRVIPGHPFCQTILSLLERCPLLRPRGSITWTYGTCCQEFVSLLELCAVLKVSLPLYSLSVTASAMSVLNILVVHLVTALHWFPPNLQIDNSLMPLKLFII